MICIGGYYGRGREGNKKQVLHKEVNVLDLEKLQWSKLRVKPPEELKRAFHHTFLVQDSLLVFGGNGAENAQFPLVSCWKLDLALESFEEFQYEGRGPLFLRNVAAEFVERTQNVVTFGGEGNNGYCVDTVYAMYLPAKRWRLPQVQGQAPGRRRSHASCISGTTLFVWGGFNRNDGFMRDLGLLEVLAEPFRWSCPRLGGPGAVPRIAATMTWVDGLLYIFGGIRRDALL